MGGKFDKSTSSMDFSNSSADGLCGFAGIEWPLRDGLPLSLSQPERRCVQLDGLIHGVEAEDAGRAFSQPESYQVRGRSVLQSLSLPANIRSPEAGFAARVGVFFFGSTLLVLSRGEAIASIAG